MQTARLLADMRRLLMHVARRMVGTPAIALTASRMERPWPRRWLRYLDLLRHPSAAGYFPASRLPPDFALPDGLSLVHGIGRTGDAGLDACLGPPAGRMIFALDTRTAENLAARGFAVERMLDVAMQLHDEVADHQRSRNFRDEIARALNAGLPGLGDALRGEVYDLDVTLRRLERCLAQAAAAGATRMVFAASEYALPCAALAALARNRQPALPLVELEADRTGLWLYRAGSARLPLRPVPRRPPAGPSAASPVGSGHDAAAMAPVMVITDAEPESIYWRGLLPVLQALHRAKGRAKGRAGAGLRIFSTRHATRSALGAAGFDACAIPLADEHLDTGIAGRLELALQQIRAALVPRADLEPDVIRRTVIDQLAGDAYYRDAAADAVRRMTALAGMMDAEQPRSLLALPCWDPAALQAIVAAHARGVPSLSFPTVTVSGDDWSIVNWQPDRVACYGEQCAAAFTAIGFEPHRLLLVGNPAYDELYRPPDAAELEHWRAKLVPGQRKVILVATTRADRDEAEWLADLRAACIRRGDVHLLIRPHPNFRPEEYGADLAAEHEPMRLAMAAPLRVVLALAHACVTDMSTVGVQAVLAGLPLVVANFSGRDFVANPYEEWGVASKVTDRAALADEVFRILDMPRSPASAVARTAFTRAYNWGDDGRAADRIADLLLHGLHSTPKGAS